MAVAVAEHKAKIESAGFLRGKYPPLCKMLPPLPSDEELLTMEKFPYPEGHQLEFKQQPIKYDKLLATICAFLNCDGGYLIIGIKDATLDICGIPKEFTDKNIDTFMLGIDQIYRQELLVDNDGCPISPFNIQVRNVFNSMKRLVIIRIEPDGRRYHCKYSGAQYIRLSCSNSKLSNSCVKKYYTDDEVKSIVYSELKAYKKTEIPRIIEAHDRLREVRAEQNPRLINLLEHENKKLKDMNNELKGENKSLRTELKKTTKLDAYKTHLKLAMEEQLKLRAELNEARAKLADRSYIVQKCSCCNSEFAKI